LYRLLASPAAYLDWRAAQAIDLSEGNVEASLRSLGARIDATNDTIATTATQFDALSQADASSDDAIAALKLQQSDINERLRLLNSLPIRISNTEAVLASMQGVSDGARDNWLLGEAEYYMQLANAQLQLAGNPALAALALGMADERIAQLANPALTNVRIALADEVATLEGMQTTDIEGVTLKLASIARVVETLPLRPIDRIEDEAAATPEEELGPMDRAWSKFKGATSDMIKHRTTDETVMPLISPEAEYFLRTNLALQMQTARLALLRGERQIYESSLNDSAEWLSTYFDATSSQVGAALDTIGELKGAMVAAENPDISGSLRLLRRHTSVSENAQ
jgi:uroporphyrin-3 C-methyltransferase